MGEEWVLGNLSPKVVSPEPLPTTGVLSVFSTSPDTIQRALLPNPFPSHRAKKINELTANWTLKDCDFPITKRLFSATQVSGCISGQGTEARGKESSGATANATHTGHTLEFSFTLQRV